MQKIFSSNDYKKAIKYFKICKNEHWNFHGDDLLIDKNNLKIIDPDTSIDFNDSFLVLVDFYILIFMIRVFIKYLIETNNFIFCEKLYRFKLKTIWSNQANKNYSILSKFINENKYSNNIFIKKLNLNYYDIYRIKIMYLYCLVRGINRDYQKTYIYLDKNVLNFYSDIICIYICSLLFMLKFLNFTIMKDNFYYNKNVLITGGTKGIGLSTVMQFIDLGSNVIYTYRKERRYFHQLRTELVQKTKVLEFVRVII